MKGVAIFLLAVLFVAQIIVGPSEAVVACNQVNGAIAPCLTYLTKGGVPSSQCCAGVSTVKNLTPTKADQKAACNCLKQSSASYKTIRDDLAVSLPHKCNVQLSIPFSRNTDCNKII